MPAPGRKEFNFHTEFHRRAAESPIPLSFEDQVRGTGLMWIKEVLWALRRFNGVYFDRADKTWLNDADEAWFDTFGRARTTVGSQLSNFSHSLSGLTIARPDMKGRVGKLTNEVATALSPKRWMSRTVAVPPNPGRRWWREHVGRIPERGNDQYGLAYFSLLTTSAYPNSPKLLPQIVRTLNRAEKQYMKTHESIVLEVVWDDQVDRALAK